MAPTTAGTWNLTTVAETAPPESLLLSPYGRPQESLFDPDSRKVVAAADFAPGGKYRSIVKLQMHYEKQAPDDNRWAMGTGWLIRPDLLVTAGHCVYDWSHEFGRAVAIKAYIGYNGKSSIGTPNVQFRQGVQVVTTAGWLKSADNQMNDVSFIRLDKPFTGVVPFTFAPTPVSGNEVLGVVGYPGDQSFNDEKGGQMYYEFQAVQYNISSSKQHMLEYRINTYAGQSGSPVIRQGTSAAIGAHVYGGSGNNSASPIKGTYGNPYNDYIKVFSTTVKTLNTTAGIRYVSIPSSESNGESSMGEEGFLDVLKSVIKIGAPIASNVLQTGFPFLGPVGGPIAAIAGTALGFAGKMAESTMGDGGTPVSQGLAERALLGEAALQHVLAMDGHDVQELGIFDTMKKVYTSLAPTVKDLAPKILPVVMEPALRIALDNIQKMKSTGGTEADFPVSQKRRPVPAPTGAEADLEVDPQVAGFYQALLKPTLPVQGAEGFFDSIGSVFKTAVTVATPFVPALGVLSGLLGNKTESDFGESETETAGHLNILCQRALMGEAALQALMQAPPKSLNQESFLDVLKTVVQKIGPVVLKVAPTVIKNVAPIVSGILGNQPAPAANGASGTESGFADGFTGRPSIGRKKSQTFLETLTGGKQPMSVSFIEPSRTQKVRALKISTGSIPNALPPNQDGLFFDEL